MSNGNAKKAGQLGMPFGTAAHKLRKLMMFTLATKAGMTTCYRCNLLIDKVKEFSMEHKIPWLNSPSPVDLFFDINNIAFSHLSCNIADARKNKKSTEYHRKRNSDNARKNYSSERRSLKFQRTGH